MKKFIALYLFIAIAASHSFAQSNRIKYNFNPGWKLYAGDEKGAELPAFDDESWQSVTLPHAWNEDDAFKRNIFEHSIGIVWYRKHFKIPESDNGKKIFLEFEGVRQVGEFYLNGKFIGLHENGAMAFGFDVTDLIKKGEDNVIAVRIDNAWDYLEKASQVKFQWADRNFNANYGGLPKNVWLHVTDKIYQTLPLYAILKTTGVYVYAKDFNIPAKTATVVTESEVKNDYPSSKIVQYEVEIKDLEGKTVKIFEGGKTTIKAAETKKVSASATLSNLNFWSWGYGYLYTVSTRLKVNGITVDEVNTKTGFRKTEFKDGSVYLNDRVLMMKGYAQRTSNEWPSIGLSVPPWLSDYSNGLMVESNANLVRWMHITPWKQDIESCDRVGLIQAMQAGDAEKDVEGPRWTQRTNLMREAIIYNRNNPSILFYECGNESISEEHMAQMKAIRDQYDPHGARAIGSREMLDSKVAEYGGEMLYTNKSAHIPMWAMEYSRDEGLRKYWDEFSPPFHKEGDGPLYRNAAARQYNRNQDSHALEDVVRWYEFWRERPGTGTRVSAGGVNIIFSDSNTHYRGAENYRRSGEVDALRIPKDGFYVHQLMWNGWVDVDKHATHILGHWNYLPGTKKNIYVISSGEKAELFINNQSKGFGERRDGFIFTFKDIQWQPGTIRAVSYDNKNNKLSEKEMKTAGTPASLKLTLQQGPQGLKADGADLALFQIEVVDEQGNRCPTALNTIDFTLEGNAEWRGGLAQGAENYILSKFLPVEGGVNRVLIRSTTSAGPIKLSAHSPGLQPTSISLNSVAVKVTNGLSLDMPYDGIKSNLKRGPTPQGPSFTPSRIALKITDVAAGANADKAKASYDDNELSDWVNDNKLSTAWIKYTFDKESIVHEVTLKMNNFASRTYPISILVDDKEAFRGTTYRSQGYCTLILNPTKGKSVTIKLFNPNSGKDESKISVELGGKKLDDGVARNDGGAKETLSIIEAEIYTKPGAM
ncbi:MAG: glycoside hydrolase family 2 protein [Pyrinomonadaceae bacterium]|nr:glycoside hydrolase family 2 protein [Sphingobacteriaceae bacterium]